MFYCNSQHLLKAHVPKFKCVQCHGVFVVRFKQHVAKTKSPLTRVILIIPNNPKHASTDTNVTQTNRIVPKTSLLGQPTVPMDRFALCICTCMFQTLLGLFRLSVLACFRHFWGCLGYLYWHVLDIRTGIFWVELVIQISMFGGTIGLFWLSVLACFGYYWLISMTHQRCFIPLQVLYIHFYPLFCHFSFSPTFLQATADQHVRASQHVRTSLHVRASQHVRTSLHVRASLHVTIKRGIPSGDIPEVNSDALLPSQTALTWADHR